jgi:hypothetical protein
VKYTWIPPDSFVGRYPYFVPNMISAMITAVGVILAYFFVVEPDRGTAEQRAKKVAQTKVRICVYLYQ